MFRVSGPGHVDNVDCRATAANADKDDADEQFLQAAEDDARPSGCRSTKRSPRRKYSSNHRRVSVDCRATCDYARGSGVPREPRGESPRAELPKGAAFPKGAAKKA